MHSFFSSGFMNYIPAVVELSFTTDSTTQCADISIVDDEVVAVSRRGFILTLDSEEDSGLYIDRRHSHSVTYVEILDNGQSYLSFIIL